jgi:hypothetical protein
VSSLAGADGIHTGISFSGWKIQSTEDLFTGKRHTSYPLQNLFDRRKETAWVYSGRDYPPSKSNIRGDRFYFEDYSLKVTPPKGTWIDELRIMNGYNKSESLFRKNSRVIEIEIYDGWDRFEYDDKGLKVQKKPIRSLKLSDTLGEKSVWLPKRKYDQLVVHFKGILRGEEDDLCISELQFRSGGKDLIPFPKTFELTDGDDCGCGGNFRLMSYPNTLIGKISNEAWYKLRFDSTGRYYAGIDQDAIWIADLSKGRKVRTLAHKGYYPDMDWIAPGKAIAKLCRPKQTPKGTEFPVIKSVKWNL